MIRTVTLAPGTARAYVEAEWAGALVVLAHGRLELEARDGGRVRLHRGAVFWLAGLPLLALRNEASGPAVLAVLTRAAAEPPDRGARRAPGACGNAGRGAGVIPDMTLPLLLLFAAGTLLPCVGLWAADQRARHQSDDA